MNLILDDIKQYKSKSQRARVMTESWVEHNMFCPICGNPMLEHYIANRPVADFFCPQCNADYELKSQERNCIAFNGIIPDGCYSTMIERITSLKIRIYLFLLIMIN